LVYAILIRPLRKSMADIADGLKRIEEKLDKGSPK
jgi:hypothetical protein